MTVFRASGTTRRVHAHKLLVETAREMAHSLYDEMMKDNRRFEMWKESCKVFGDGSELLATQYEEIFVNETFPMLIEAARATLAELLSTTISDVLKNEIHEALIKDAPFRAGRLRAQMKDPDEHAGKVN